LSDLGAALEAQTDIPIDFDPPVPFRGGVE
jgi:hypothetical protein